MESALLLLQSSGADTTTAVDLLGILLTAMSLIVPIIVFLIKSFSESVEMDLSEKYETGTKAWDIAIDNSEESLFAMKSLTQALILISVGILYILAAFLQQTLGTVVIPLLSANIAVGVGSLVFIIAILYIVYMSMKFYKNRRRSWERIRDTTENAKLPDFESGDEAKESQDTEEFEKEID